MPDIKQIIRSKIILVSVAIVVLIGVAGYGLYSRYSESAPVLDGGQDTAVLADFERQIDTALQLRSAGDLDGAIELLNTAQTETAQAEERSYLLAELGRLYFEQGDYAAALECYQGAEELGLTESEFVVSGVIELARKTEQFALELDYQRRYIELLEPQAEPEAVDTGESNYLVAQAQARVAELEGILDES
ncbi:MAG: hypothetical protein WD467_01650 [Candidatus Saccharimonadales bacterium]